LWATIPIDTSVVEINRSVSIKAVPPTALNVAISLHGLRWRRKARKNEMIYVIVICVSVPSNPNVGHCEYENGGWTYQTLQECQEREGGTKYTSIGTQGLLSPTRAATARKGGRSKIEVNGEGFGLPFLLTVIPYPS
jgi:hypothetical protein